MALAATAAAVATAAAAGPPPIFSVFISSSPSYGCFCLRSRQLDKYILLSPVGNANYNGWRTNWRFPLDGIAQSRRRSARFCLSNEEASPSADVPLNFCIIEGPETVQDFVKMQLQEIQDNIRSRRNKIFLLMEEVFHKPLAWSCDNQPNIFLISHIFRFYSQVRRLRVQQRIKSADLHVTYSEEIEMPDIPSTIPFVPRMTTKTLKQLYLTSFSMIAGIIVFGGLLAPVLELKLGVGGTSYEDFIRSMHLPLQLSQVDPIVASFSGGAVGVISALMLVEVNNVEQQEKKRCKYCHGTGYLACARCSSSGVCLEAEPLSLIGDSSKRPLRAPRAQRCGNCSGSGKVMCPTCLCTGMLMASEHDPRIEPFD